YRVHPFHLLPAHSFMFLSLSCSLSFLPSLLFFFNDTATTEIYTLSLHDALPISSGIMLLRSKVEISSVSVLPCSSSSQSSISKRSEEHTSELQSRENLVCRLLLEKKKKKKTNNKPKKKRIPVSIYVENKLKSIDS